MNAEVVQELDRRAAHEQTRASRREAWARSARVHVIRLLGPGTIVAGLAWAVVQPYRLTLLHPHGQGFWWLLSEPPLFVAVAGLLFHLVVARGLVEDLEREGG